MMQLGLLMDALPVGGYANALKAVPPLLLLLLWAKLLAWADKDAQTARLPRMGLNIGLLSGLVLGYLLFLFLPVDFVVALPVLLGVFVVEVVVYLVLRHRSVGLGDLQGQWQEWTAGLKLGKGKKQEKEVVAAPGQVLLADKKGAPMTAPALEDPQRAGYDAAQALLADPLRRNAERIDLAPGGEGACVVRYEVDGVAYGAPSLERAFAAEATTLLKRLAGMDVQEKRKPQTGTMRSTVEGKHKTLQVQTRGSAAGEHLAILVDPKKRHDKRLKDLGLAEDQDKLVREVIAEKGGIVLVAAPKGHGLTSMLYGIIREHDAFLTHIQTIERDPDTELEGITQNKLPATATAADEAKLVDWVTSQEADVLLISQVESPASISALLNYAENGRRVYIAMRAGSTFDALALWRRAVGDDGLAMKYLRLVLAGRVARKLCTACKVGYRPDPETLRKLNMDPQRINQLFQARTQPLVDSRGRPIPCDFCKDLHYHGRFGLFETFLIDDDVRQIVLAGGSANQLKAAFRKQRGRYLQEHALAHVETGDTSVQEMLRVLRAADPAAPAAAGGTPPAASGTHVLPTGSGSGTGSARRAT